MHSLESFISKIAFVLTFLFLFGLIPCVLADQSSLTDNGLTTAQVQVSNCSSCSGNVATGFLNSGLKGAYLCSEDSCKFMCYPGSDCDTPTTRQLCVKAALYAKSDTTNPYSIRFIDQSTGENVESADYYWDFGDTSWEEGYLVDNNGVRYIDHIYENPGQYTVELHIRHEGPIDGYPGSYYDSCSKASVQVSVKQGLSITSIYPNTGYELADSLYVSIYGTGFVKDTKFILNKNNFDYSIMTSSILPPYIAFGSIHALPYGYMGKWNLIAKNPDGTSAILKDAFTLSSQVPGTVKVRVFSKKYSTGLNYQFNAQPNAKITIKNSHPSNIWTQTGLTDSTGFYQFNNVPPSIYYYSVDMEYKTTTGAVVKEQQLLNVFSGKESYLTFPEEYLEKLKEATNWNLKIDIDKMEYEFTVLKARIRLAETMITILALPISIATAPKNVKSILSEHSGKWLTGSKIFITYIMPLLSPIPPSLSSWVTGQLNNLIFGAYQSNIDMLKNMYQDPPDPQYKIIYNINPPQYTQISTSPLDDENVKWGKLKFEQLNYQLKNTTELEHAVLVSFERYQGALDAKDFASMKMQLEMVITYSKDCKVEWGKLTTVANEISGMLLTDKNTYGADLIAEQSAIQSNGIPTEIRQDLIAKGLSETDINNLQILFNSASYDQTISFFQDLQSIANDRITAQDKVIQSATTLLASLPVVNNPVPSISSISPASTTAGGSAFTLTVTGSNFVAASKVRWNGADRTTTYVSSTKLTASIPTTDIKSAGSATITVFNPTPGGGTSGSKTFTITAALNPVPSILSISPTSATAGGSAFTLTVTGSNFVAASKIRWNGADKTTTYVSSTQLTASIPTTDIKSAGSATITVFNPSPGGGTSGSKTINIINALTPSVTGITPLSSKRGQTIKITNLAGGNFVDGAQAYLYTSLQGGWYIYNVGGTGQFTVVSPSKITCSFFIPTNAPLGTYDVNVKNPGGNIGTLKGAFKVTA
jgi:hypothetical protein